MDRGEEIGLAANAVLDGLNSLEGFDKIDTLNKFAPGFTWAEEHAKSVWISVDERFPDDKEQVLVSSRIYGKVVLVWDELGMVWLYPESDEVYCDWNKVDCWMPIPE